MLYFAENELGFNFSLCSKIRLIKSLVTPMYNTELFLFVKMYTEPPFFIRHCEGGTTEAISIVIAKEELPVPIHRERSNLFAFYYHRTDCFGLANSLIKDTLYLILAMTFRIDRHCEGGTTEAISIVIA